MAKLATIVVASAFFLAACGNDGDYSPPQNSKLSSVLCITFPKQPKGRNEVTAFLEEMAVKHNGTKRIIPQVVYFKLSGAKYYLKYTDQADAYGNLLQTYWSDFNGTKLDAEVRMYLEQSFSDVEDCSSYLDSQIDAFDIEAN